MGRAGEGREEQLLSTSEDTLILGPNVRFQGKDSSRPSLGPHPSLSYPHQLRELLGLLSTRSQTRGGKEQERGKTSSRKAQEWIWW